MAESDIVPQATRINERIYMVQVVLMRMTPDGNSFKHQIEIPYDNISYMDIVNDLTEPFPRLIITLEDPDQEHVTRFPCDGYTYINVFLIAKALPDDENTKSATGLDDPTEKELLEVDSKDAILNHLFIVRDIKVLTRSNEGVTYTVSAISLLVPCWLSKIEYSTGKNPKPLTQIVDDILVRSSLKYKKVKGDFDHTDVTSTFITPTNSQVNDIIISLLYKSISKNKGLYFLKYQMMNENTSDSGGGGGQMSFDFGFTKLVAVKSDFENMKTPVYNNMTLPNKYGFAGVEEMTLSVDDSNLIGAVHAYELASDITHNKFNYINRSYKEEIFTKKDIIKTLPVPIFKGSEQTIEPIIKNIPPEYTNRMKFRYELPNLKDDFVRERIFNIFRFYSTLRIDVKGLLHRDVGQGFQIIVPNAVSANTKRYAGYYMISRIRHIFTKGNYNQSIDLIRTYQMNDEKFMKFIEDNENNDSRFKSGEFK